MCDSIANGGSISFPAPSPCPPANVTIASNILSTNGNVICANIISGDGTFTGNLYVSGEIYGSLTFSTLNISQVINTASLVASGTINANQFIGSGNTISNLNASNLAFGNIQGFYVYGNTLSNINASNIIGFSQVSGNTLSNLNASNLAFGNIQGFYIYGNTLSNINASNIVGLVSGGNISTLNVSSSFEGPLIIMNKFNGSISAGYNSSINIYNSTAIGQGAQATGGYSTAIGQGAQATGSYSTTIGQDSSACYYSTAVGQGSRAFTSASAFGQGALATGSYCTAFGGSARAVADNSTAFGYYAQATGDYSIAIGKNSQASNVFSSAIGIGAVASGVSSSAFGEGTLASGDNSSAFGSGSVASYNNSTALGCGARALAENVVVFPLFANVGINTGRPTSNLHVIGDANVSGIIHAGKLYTPTISNLGQLNITTGDQYTWAFGSDGHFNLPIGDDGYQSFIQTGANTIVFSIQGTSFTTFANTGTTYFPGLIYADGGVLSNIQASSISQPFANLLISNTITSTNVAAITANITTINVQTLESITGGLNVAGTSNLSRLFSAISNVGTLNVASSFEGPLMTINSSITATSVGFNATANITQATAFGQGAQASAYSSVFGQGAQAINNYSSAFGAGARASGLFVDSHSSSAFGYNSHATGTGSSAFGAFSSASAVFTSAFGDGAQATVGYSSAFGQSSRATGAGSSAFGNGASAYGDYSTAIGEAAQALVTNSSAFGKGASAAYNNSTALGCGATALAANVVVFPLFANVGINTGNPGAQLDVISSSVPDTGSLMAQLGSTTHSGRIKFYDQNTSTRPPYIYGDTENGLGISASGPIVIYGGSSGPGDIGQIVARITQSQTSIKGQFNSDNSEGTGVGARFSQNGDFFGDYHGYIFSSDGSTNKRYTLAIHDNNNGFGPSREPDCMVNMSRVENNSEGNFHVEFVNITQNFYDHGDYGIGMGFYDNGLGNMSSGQSPFIINTHLSDTNGSFSGASDTANTAISISMDGRRNIGINSIAGDYGQFQIATHNDSTDKYALQVYDNLPDDYNSYSMAAFTKVESQVGNYFHVEFINYSERGSYGVAMGFEPYDDSGNSPDFIISPHSSGNFTLTNETIPAISITMDGNQNVGINTTASVNSRAGQFQVSTSDYATNQYNSQFYDNETPDNKSAFAMCAFTRTEAAVGITTSVSGAYHVEFMNQSPPTYGVGQTYGVGMGFYAIGDDAGAQSFLISAHSRLNGFDDTVQSNGSADVLGSIALATDGSGYVGICGEIHPSYPLDVAGAIRSYGLYCYGPIQLYGSHPIYFNDTNKGVLYSGTNAGGSYWNNVEHFPGDGIVVFGWVDGSLGTAATGNKNIITWDYLGNIGLNGTVTASNSITTSNIFVSNISASGSFGTSGQILTQTGSGVAWSNPPSSSVAVHSVNSGTTYSVSASDYYIGCNGTGITITLPYTSTIFPGKQYVIKDESGLISTNSSYIITINTPDSKLIDGSSSLTVVNSWTSVTLLWTGFVWSII